jgi:glutathione S-transferase
MANEVVLILAARAGLADVDNVAYFRKLRAAIEGGLGWLEHQVAATDPAALRYADLALACMYQHVQHYQLLALDGYPRLAARVAELAQRPAIAATAPAAALAEAAAAGWQPA